jgi:hypothetical protein
MMAKDSSKYKYTVATLAEDLNISLGSARQRLWREEVPKNPDGIYGWTSFAKYKEVKALIKDGGRRGAPVKVAASKAKPAAKKVKAKAKRKPKPAASED